MNWNLDNIYKSIDSKEFKDDFECYKKEIHNFNSMAENFSGNVLQDLENIIRAENSLRYYDKLSIYVNLSLSVDTQNEKLMKSESCLSDLSAKTSRAKATIINYIKNIENIEEIIEKSPLLKEHKYYLENLKKLSIHTLTPEEEKIISQMKSNASNMWQKLWDSETTSLSVEYNGDSLPLSVIRNLAYDADLETRKNAYLSELKAYEKIDKAICFTLNAIKGEVNTVSELKKYASPLDMTLSGSGIDEKILNTMLSSIKKNIPLLKRYFIKKAEICNDTNGLKFYNLFAPLGKVKNYTYEEAKEFIISCFSSFSNGMGDFAKNAFENKWIDVFPKENKMGGAFCESVHQIKESRILTNFSGSFNDVLTIAHELGHSYHDSNLYNESEINSVYPMPIAETASTMCETIIVNKALENCDNDEKINILENDISGICQSIIDIYSRFLFEDEVFNRRKNGFISINELKEIMTDSQIIAYGDSLDREYLHPYMWLCKVHYYDADFNYYNFPYAFGMLFAKGLYGKYSELGDDFIPIYNKILANSGKMNTCELAKLCGIDLYKEEFWDTSFNVINKEIDEFINLHL